MTKQELIDHLQHLEKYTHYSEDAPALREVIKMLTETHGERTETHACDLIERQAAIDALHMHLMYRMGTDSNKKRLDDWINSLPSAQPDLSEYSDKLWRNAYERGKRDAQPEQQWIPCSERLPEQYGNYLVSYRTDDFESDIGTFDPDRINSDTGEWSACDANGFYWVASKGLEVIAWMPLPSPYQAERREE